MVPGGHGHAHGQRDKHGHDHSGQADPHAWQDVANVKIYAANIRDGLIAADPAGKAAYEANSRPLHRRARQAGTPRFAPPSPKFRRRTQIITGHDAFGYFARAYGVQFISPKGVSTEAEASAKDVAAVIRQAKAEKVRAIFLENIANPAHLRADRARNRREDRRAALFRCAVGRIGPGLDLYRADAPQCTRHRGALAQ